MRKYALSHLQELEAEAIYILRETAAQFENPAILFSGGKDSILVTELARKAFYPAKIPFTFLHVDTGHNFPETIAFRALDQVGIGIECDIGLVVRNQHLRDQPAHAARADDNHPRFVGRVLG